MASSTAHEAVNGSAEFAKPPFLRRVRIQGYKSIVSCEAPLQPLTVLVGRNGAGKSNFLDALGFLRDAMEVGVGEALKRRGGWSSIVCRTSETPKIVIEADVSFLCASLFHPTGENGQATINPRGVVFEATYFLDISSPGPNSVPIISREMLRIEDESRQLHGRFETHDGIGTIWKVQPKSDAAMPFPLPQSVELLHRPGLPLLGVVGTQPFLDLGDGLRNMGFYNFEPNAIRHLQKPNPGSLLERDGCNLASVIEGLREIEPETVMRVQNYLSVIAEEVQGFDVVSRGEFETVQFHLPTASGGSPRANFDAASMSEGTLRALAALMAAFQMTLPYGYPAVVGIEEPEASLHPAAMRALIDALNEATSRTQILLTSHSTEMLDNPTIRPENVLVVQMIDGQTRIGPVDEATIEIVRRKLNTLGGLERENQLEPNLDVDRHTSLVHEGAAT